MIDRTLKVFEPEEDENQKLLISWLICHPEVIIEGVKDLDEEILKKKKGNKID